MATTRYHGAACKTCRRRGKKCTRELPTCHSCQDRGVKCEGYELRWAGLASRGYLAGETPDKLTNRKKKRHNAADEDRSMGKNDTTLPERNLQTKRSRPQPEDDTEIHQTNISSLASNNDDSAEMTASWTTPDAGLQLSDQSLQQPLPTNFFTFDNEAVQGIDLLEGDLLAEDILGTISDAAPEDDFDLDIGTGEPDLTIDFSFFSPSKGHTSQPHTQMVPYPRPAMQFFEIPPDLKFILDYHVREVAAKLCVDNDTLINPYKEYVYPLALQNPALLYACAAVSSTHYSTRQCNEAYYVEALRLRGKALSRLRESMWSSSGALDEANLTTILMLILCDICMGNHANFEWYFTFAKKLIDARGAMRTHNNFVEQYISWLDIMSCASTSRKPVFTSTDVRSLRNIQAHWDHDVVPCPADIFDILLDIVDLHEKRDKILDVSAEIEVLKARTLSSPLHTERGMSWYHLTEAYRHAVLLYLLLLFEKDEDRDEIDWLVCSIVQHAKSIPSWGGWSNQLLWPLFHAGLKITDSRRQAWLESKMSEMQLSGGFRNVNSAREALRSVWNGEFKGKYADLLVREGVGDMLVV